MSDFSPKECAAAVAKLSPRQRAVLRGMASGQCTKEIAGKLKLKENTVKTYRERIFCKLRVNGLAQAVRIAVVARII